jgi:hypothetical protein
LKSHLVKLPQEQRLKAMQFLAKLQEEWFDHTEKTRVIIEFEQYIDSIGYRDSADVIDILESLLVQGQEDQSDQAITYNALTSLIPETIACEAPSDMTCKQYLVSQLDEIPTLSDNEQKTQIGAKIWDIIKIDTDMTPQQKNDFGAILKTYTYG